HNTVSRSFLTLSLHDALPILLYEQNEYGLYKLDQELRNLAQKRNYSVEIVTALGSVLNDSMMESLCREYEVHTFYHAAAYKHVRSEEHTSELQSRFDLVCRLL